MFTTASTHSPIPSTGAVYPPTLAPAFYQSPVFTRPNDAKVAPFDGSFGDYMRFETAFIAKYVSNPCYTGADQFLKLVELTGSHGKNFTTNQPMDASGLQAALILMRDYYNNPSRIRTEVRRRLDSLPAILQDPKNPLRVLDCRTAVSNIIACQTAIRQLRDCGTAPQYLNEDFYRLIVKKMPYAYASEYSRANPVYRDTHQMVAHCRERLREEENFDEDVQPTSAPPARTSSKGGRAHVNTISGSSKSKPPSANKTIKCLLCEGPHYTFKCREGTVTERAAKVAQKRLCRRCLRQGHQLPDCQSTYQCPCGSADHSSIICSVLENQRRARQQSASNNHNGSSSSSSAASPASASSAPSSSTSPKSSIASVTVVDGEQPSSGGTAEAETSVVIPSGFYSQTVLVRVRGLTVRALLDSGAQPTVILRSLAERLQLPATPAALRVSGALGKKESQTLTKEVTAKVESLGGNQSLNVNFYPVDDIDFECGHLPTPVISKLRKSGFKLKHTSAQSMKEYPVSLIIGGGYHGAVFRGQGPRDVCPGFSISRSIFGHVILGHVRGGSAAAQVNTIITEQQQKEYEAVSGARPDYDADKKEGQKYTAEYIAKSVTFKDGRYEVRMPRIEPITNLGNNLSQAEKRLKHLDSRLRKLDLYEQYNSNMQTYIKEFAEPVPECDTEEPTFYLPHHAVYRPEKTTTKVRVVFDGASHAPGQQPVNDYLFKGFVPWNAQEAFTRFRLGDTAVVADIAKAYLMVGLHPADRDLTRFLWYNEAGEVVHYRFTRVPFGLASSPFQLAAVMQHHFDRYRQEFADVIPLLEGNFYVDDLLLAFPLSAGIDLHHLRARVEELFRLGGFAITKWATNHPVVRHQWTPDITELKTLGHLWSLEADTICPIANVGIPKAITKRSLSSFLAGIYDLAGIALPYVVSLRLELRQLWQLGCDWDDSLPEEISSRIRQLMEDSSNLSGTAVPRNIIGEGDHHLIVYSDASKDAVGAVAYCRTSSSTRFIMAKASLSNQPDMPKAELDGLFMAARLAKLLKTFYSFSSISIYSDSKVNLDRLLQHPNKLASAVAVRIARLKRVVEADYLHVTSALNSADIVSRGTTLTKLIKSPIWKSPAIEPSTCFHHHITAQVFTLAAQPVLPSECKCRPFDDFATMFDYYRAEAETMRKAATSENEALSSADLDTITWQLIVQQSQQHFAEDITALKQQKPLPRQSRLANYNVNIDQDGLLRLATRLQNHAGLTKDEIYPMVLSNVCCITRLIIEHFHDRGFHPGESRTMSLVREKFFVLRSKRTVKAVVSRCQVCRRERGARQTQLFGSLPSFRLTENLAPFTFTGIDLFGPICVNAAIPYKRSGVIFVCAVTRAIHIELVTDQTADQFCLALRRFMARRGVPEKVYSDNGSQLVKTRKQLLQYLSQVKTQHPEVEIRLQEWMLQAPGSPWRGGFYERLIGSVKRALKSVIYRRPRSAKKDINDAELQTVLAEIEARVNDRPLFTITDDNGEVVSVSPSSFLRGRRLSTLPTVGIKGHSDLERPDIIDAYLKNSRLVNGLWNSFRECYVKELRNYHQNYRRPGPQFHYRPGDVVLVTSNLPREQWPTAVIKEVFTSPDGIIRTAAVRMKLNGTLQTSNRDTKNLIPLELVEEQHAAQNITTTESSPTAEATE